MNEVKKAYSYDSTTKEYVGETNAYKSPLEKNVYLKPAHSTFVEPPKAGKNKKQIFDEATNKWSIVDDYRGTFYHKDNQSTLNITELNKKPSDEYTEIPPNKEYEINQTFVNGKWEFSIEKYRKNILFQLDRITSMKILSTYPLYKQLNITNGIEPGKDKMIVFITKTKKEHSKAESAIKKAKSKQDIDTVINNYKG